MMLQLEEVDIELKVLSYSEGWSNYGSHTVLNLLLMDKHPIIHEDAMLVVRDGQDILQRLDLSNIESILGLEDSLMIIPKTMRKWRVRVDNVSQVSKLLLYFYSLGIDVKVAGENIIKEIVCSGVWKKLERNNEDTIDNVKQDLILMDCIKNIFKTKSEYNSLARTLNNVLCSF